MADTTLPKALETLAVSKTKELKGTEKRDALIEIEKVRQRNLDRGAETPQRHIWTDTQCAAV